MKILKLTLIFVVVLGAIAGGFFLMTKTESDPLPEIDTEHLKYPCDKCDMKFISEDELKKHKDDFHKSAVKAPIQPELKFKCRCPGCDMKFISEDELKKHKDDFHKSVVKAPIQSELKFKCRCPGCDMKYSNITDQYNHELTAHPDKIHKCPLVDCGYFNFTGIDDLNRHLKEVHNEE